MGPCKLYARLRIPFGRKYIIGLFHLFSLGLRSKKGFFDDALMGMAIHWRQFFNRSSRSTAQPAENMNRLSPLKSAALAQAEPMAIPTSTLLMAQGTFAVPDKELHAGFFGEPEQLFRYGIDVFIA